MRSSSTEPGATTPGPTPPTPPRPTSSRPTNPGPTTPDPVGRARSTAGTTGTRGRAASLLPEGRAARLRLVLIVLLGLAALMTPRIAERTGAVYTDRAVVGGDVWATPGPPPPPSPSPSPAAPSSAAATTTTEGGTPALHRYPALPGPAGAQAQSSISSSSAPCSSDRLCSSLRSRTSRPASSVPAGS